MILEVDKVTKDFGGIRAVDRVSFGVEKGEFCAVIGPNGAGKSTLFNVLTGFHKKDGGRVKFKGEDISTLEPHEICRRGIGRSFQLVNLFQRMNVFENIRTAILSGRGFSRNFFKSAKRMMIAETEELLENIGLLDKRGSLSGDLSHGEQRRLELGLALANKPDLVFLDEPCAGLTSEETRIMVSLIKRIAEETGLTVILVEHKMDVVFSISSVIRVLHEGRIIFEGTPEAVKGSEQVLKVYLGEEDYDGAAVGSR